MQKSMVEGNTLKLILNFSIPLLLGNLFQQFYNVVDAAIVGQTLGSKALAAVGASSSVQFLILGFCMGICQGFAIMVSQSYGAKRLDEMQTYIYAGAIWTAITALWSAMTCMAPAREGPSKRKINRTGRRELPKAPEQIRMFWAAFCVPREIFREPSAVERGENTEIVPINPKKKSGGT